MASFNIYLKGVFFILLQKDKTLLPTLKKSLPYCTEFSVRLN